MKLLIFGATGQVGRELQAFPWPDSTKVCSLGREQVDVTDPASIGKAILTSGADFVVNASAYTAVDRAEDEPDIAMAVNGLAPGQMAKACAELAIPLLHISTDYVFDGSKKAAYEESDSVKPLGVYGRSKELGEREVRANLAHHIIIRTAWVYSAHGQNFVKTMLRLGGERDELNIVNDQYGCPTSARSIAKAIAAIVNVHEKTGRLAWGTYHFCGADKMNWFQFAETIFRLAALKSDKIPILTGIPSIEYPTPAKRPANSTLNCGKIYRQLSISTTPCESELEPVIATLLDQGN